MSASGNWFQNLIIDIFFPITVFPYSDGTQQVSVHNTTSVHNSGVKRILNADYLYHFIVFLSGLLYALIWSERLKAFFPALYLITMFGFMTNYSFIVRFSISLISRKKEKFLLCLFISRSLILCCFHLQ